MNPIFTNIKLEDQEFSMTPIHLEWTREVTWSVRNLDSLPKLVDYSLDSDPFELHNATWCLRMYPNCTQGGSHFIGLTIVRLHSIVPHHNLHYYFESLGSYKGTCSRTVEFTEDLKEAGDLNFFSSFGMNLRDGFKVRCHVSCFASQATDALLRTEGSIEDVKDAGVLCQNLKDLLVNGRYHDVVFKVKNVEFRAHKAILCARSTVLKIMLNQDMIENRSGVIEITDCDPSAFEQFLLYLYSGQVDVLDTDNMLPLYFIADKYDVPQLKNKCRDLIKKSLSIKNIVNVIQIAIYHSDDDLSQCATDYFKKEFVEILQTPEWLSFIQCEPDKANEVFIKAAKSMGG